MTFISSDSRQGNLQITSKPFIGAALFQNRGLPFGINL